MKKAFLWIFGGGVVVLGGVVAAGSWLVVGMFGECREEIVQEERSTGGEWTATVIVRNCGATTDFAVAVKITRRGQATESGHETDVFTADSNHGAASYTMAGGPRVEVRWLASDHLRIQFDPRARVFRQDSAVNAVKIDYTVLGAADGVGQPEP